jgi:hypothetical protein
MPDYPPSGVPFLRKDTKMHALRHVPTSDLMVELVQRTIAHDDKEASPRSLLDLACLMASMLGPWRCLVFAEQLRDAADQLENLERVHVVQ